MIKYLGSKRLLVPAIVAAIGEMPGVRRVADVFSGTARVGHALKRAGLRVYGNDHNAYAATLARCYVQADDDLAAPATRLIAELNALRGRPGYFTETFCVQSRFFQPQNGERVDAIRDAIARKGLPPELEAVLLVSLMEAADRVDSTTGVQMAYLKEWARRSHQPLQLRLPELLPCSPHGKGAATELDAVDAAACDADVAYLDPPYNQHKYLGNYHIWETLVRWDAPESYGVARKRLDVRTRASSFNSRREIHDALARLVAAVRAPRMVVSFSNEGFVTREEMEALLATRGHVSVREHDFRRYVGARIGIYNPSGEKVGNIGHLTNKEYLYLVTPEPLPP